MTLQEIKEFVQVVTDTGIAELEVQRGENRVRIRRGAVDSRDVVAVAPPATQQPAPAPPDFQPVAAVPAQSPAEASTVLVKAPIVGTFYEAPAPDRPAFVRVGDTVRPGQVLCIIESMKLMNEIEAEVGGVIVAKLVENGHPVEYGEALFSIRPQ